MKQKTGLVLGKFMPPHLGHQQLIYFAQSLVDRLCIVVGTMPGEPIPGQLRFQWMRESFPNAVIVHLNQVMPQQPNEHPDFWKVWREALEEVLPFRPDLVFAGEAYGEPLAEVLGADFMPLDRKLTGPQISATAVRDGWRAHYPKILPAARPYFLKRICVLGAESTGKTTLCNDLATLYQTVMVTEYARIYLEHFGSQVREDMFEPIIKGRLALEQAMTSQATGFLFADTNSAASTIWYRRFFGAVPKHLQEIAASDHHDAYILTDPNIPFEEEPIRYFPEERQDFFEANLAWVKQTGKPYLVVEGNRETRLERARQWLEQTFP